MALRGSQDGTSPTTSGDETTSLDGSPRAVVVAKKRKSTYYARKDESEELTKDVKKLMRKLTTLEASQAQSLRPLRASLAANSMLKACVKQHRRAIAATQSIASSYSAHSDDLPLGGYIHLPVDKDAHQELIHSMKAQKINDAVEYLMQRSQFVDLQRPSRQMENYVTEEGDHVALHWEIACFHDDAMRVPQVFSDMQYFVGNQELEMAEKLGSMSIRESDFDGDSIDSTQVRMVSTHKRDIQAEKNIVLYSQLFQQSAFCGHPHGVLAVDYVNEDDAYPYQPQARLRKDLVSAAMVVEAPAKNPHDRPVVSLIRWAYMKIHNSPLATPEEMQELSRDGIHQYFDSMVRVIRERHAWQNPVVTSA